jgi:hypothetical protein
MEIYFIGCCLLFQYFFVAGVLYYVFNTKNLKDLLRIRKQLIEQLNEEKYNIQ